MIIVQSLTNSYEMFIAANVIVMRMDCHVAQFSFGTALTTYTDKM